MIGIIVAMQEELNEILKVTKQKIVNKHYDDIFYIGNIGNKECVITLSGVGKVNSARITQILIDNYHPNFIINTGVAGGLKKSINIGDIIIGEKLVQYDFDLSIFGREKGEISDKVGKFLYSDINLIKKAEQVFFKNLSISIYKGIIATGDTFVSDSKVYNHIIHTFNADCVEMEGASIAQVCFLDNTPFIVIRCISDTNTENNIIEYDKFLQSSSQKTAQFLEKFIYIL